MQVSCYLQDPADINGYMDNAAGLVAEKRCWKQWIRADITPSGDVVPCIQLPDFVFGSLENQTIDEIWNNERFKEFRKRALCGNHPLCGKCNCIYLYDSSRKYL
jgi:radical SAM protein with 4Fe4S-binding SPASM domain